MKNVITNLIKFTKKENVLMISALAAIISMFYVPLNISYINYIDFRVLAILFCLMAVIMGFNNIGVFDVMSKNLLKHIKGTRMLCYILILLCFILSMWITNDVALLTLVPFTILVLTMTKQENLMIFVIVMETIGANLGSMLTPVGNPQNLYLYTYYDLNASTFFLITIPIVRTSFIILTIPMFFIKNNKITLIFAESSFIRDKKKLIIYILLFLISIGCVFHLISYQVTFVIILLTFLIIDRNSLLKVDYSLLLTFVYFFIFVGNVGQIEVITNFMNDFIKGKVFLTSIVLSQGISNVPAAVLLSTFTDDYKNLILGTNIGGLGTIIASLASLISYKLYAKVEGKNIKKYLLLFTLLNFFSLIILLLVYKIIY